MAVKLRPNPRNGYPFLIRQDDPSDRVTHNIRILRYFLCTVKNAKFMSFKSTVGFFLLGLPGFQILDLNLVFQYSNIQILSLNYFITQNYM